MNESRDPSVPPRALLSTVNPAPPYRFAERIPIPADMIQDLLPFRYCSFSERLYLVARMCSLADVKILDELHHPQTSSRMDETRPSLWRPLILWKESTKLDAEIDQLSMTPHEGGHHIRRSASNVYPKSRPTKSISNLSAPASASSGSPLTSANNL